MTPAQQSYRRAVARKDLVHAVEHLTSRLGTHEHVHAEFLDAARELVETHGRQVLENIGADDEMFKRLRGRVEGFARAIDAHLEKARPAPVGFTHLFAVCVDGQPGMVCTSSEEAHEFVRWSKFGDRAEVWPVEAAGSLVQALTSVGGDQC